jgi:hypothetical protein
MGEEPRRPGDGNVVLVLFLGLFGGGVLGALMANRAPASEYRPFALIIGSGIGIVLGVVASLTGLLVAKVILRLRARGEEDG